MYFYFGVINRVFIIIIVIIIIIIALDNAPYKMLHKLKSACSIRKKQLWTSASLSVSQKSQNQPTDPSIQQATHSNNWDQQRQKLSNPNPSCSQAQQDPRERQISKSTDQKLLNLWCKKQQGKPERDL